MGRRPAPAAAVLAAVLVAALVTGCSAASTPSSGPSSASSVVATADDLPAVTTSAAPGVQQVVDWTAPDGTRVQYVLVVPPGRAAGAPGKVLLTFPPGGQDLDLTQRIVADRWRTEALARGWVVVSPAATAKGLWYQPELAALVPALLDEVARTYPPEGGRFDLAGVSNGGLSAFAAAEGAPRRFRSLVVFPGMPPDDDAAALAGLKGLGAAFYVGALDTGWLEGSHKAADALQAMGNTVELHEVAGQGHILENLTGTELFDAMERVRG